jgi:hypothetical protein
VTLHPQKGHPPHTRVPHPQPQGNAPALFIFGEILESYWNLGTDGQDEALLGRGQHSFLVEALLRPQPCVQPEAKFILSIPIISTLG